MLALLIFTALSGWRSCGVVITKFSAHVVPFRSSPTVFADTPVPTSASTCILAGKPPRAMSSAAMLLHLYRGIRSFLIARLLDSQPLKTLLSRDMRRSEGTGRSKGSRTISWMEYRTLWDGVSVALNFAILPRESRDKRRQPSLLPLPWLPRRSTPGRQIAAMDAIAVGGRERERHPHARSFRLGFPHDGWSVSG